MTDNFFSIFSSFNLVPYGVFMLKVTPILRFSSSVLAYEPIFRAIQWQKLQIIRFYPAINTGLHQLFHFLLPFAEKLAKCCESLPILKGMALAPTGIVVTH